MRRTARVATLAVAVAMVATMTGCGSGDQNKGTDSADTTLTIYTDQHMELVNALADAYTEKTGVKFQIQGDSSYGQVEAEGKASPADLFLSEDPAPVALLGKAGLLEKLDASTLDNVDESLNSPDGLWVAYAARARVLYYNPELIDEKDLPKSLFDIVDSKYAGEFAYAPSGAFRATTQYLISTIGKEKTTKFLEELKANGVDEQKNGNVRDTVEAGKHAMGLSNHYYWYRKAAEVGGEQNMTSKVYHFPQEDPGNLILSSGAGILSGSDHKEAAADFLAWLTSADGGQKILIDGDVDVSGAQYPVAKGTSSKVVGSLEDVKSPKYDMGIYADQAEAEDLLKGLGISN